MKKYIGYFIVGILSAATTVGGVYLLQKKESGSFITVTNDKNDNAFSYVDYKGNYAVTTPDFVDASQRTVNVVVSIKNYSNGTNRRQSFDPFEDFFFGPQRQQRDPSEPNGMGSGVIISQDGYIVTNNHVIKGSNKIEVVLNNQKSYTAELVGTDPSTDIALIKIDDKDLPYIKFVDSDNINVGDWVLAVGNPFGLNSTVTAGIVSAKGRSINNLLERNTNKTPIESFIQTDAAINPGNSGGALVNPNGDLVGINTAISSPTGSYAGYGFAVPSNLVKKIVEDIKKFGLVQRGYLGISGFDLSDEDVVKQYNKAKDKNVKSGSGVYVTTLADNGGAEDAGIEEGDIITKIDGANVKNMNNLTYIIGSKRPGDKVTVTINRNGKTKEYKVTLRDEKGNSNLRSKADLTVSEKLGAEFEPLTERQKVSFGIDYGVMAKNVDSSGKLSSIGINDNYIILKINDKEIKDDKDVERILKGHEGRVNVSYVDPYGRIYTRGFVLD